MSESIVDTRAATVVKVEPTRTRDVIGRGVDFPFQVEPTGGVRLTTGEDVKAAIHMIIMTAPGERVMRPEFGCAIWEHVYSPVNIATLGQMEHAVRRALVQWEPRIDVLGVEVTPNPSGHERVDIRVDYELKATNDRRNLVFPFYLIPEEAPS